MRLHPDLPIDFGSRPESVFFLININQVRRIHGGGIKRRSARIKNYSRRQPRLSYNIALELPQNDHRRSKLTEFHQGDALVTYYTLSWGIICTPVY